MIPKLNIWIRGGALLIFNTVASGDVWPFSGQGIRGVGVGAELWRSSWRGRLWELITCLSRLSPAFSLSPFSLARRAKAVTHRLTLRAQSSFYFRHVVSIRILSSHLCTTQPHCKYRYAGDQPGSAVLLLHNGMSSHDTHRQHILLHRWKTGCAQGTPRCFWCFRALLIF